jgi:hypothetical protein
MATVWLHACIGSALVPVALAQQTPVEYQMKAAYLAKIPNFVQWPNREAANTANSSDVIRLCVVGSYAFGTLLAQEGNRAASTGKRMQVQWIHKTVDLRGCQIIFVSRSERSSYERTLNAAKGMNALTVGETDGFLEAGGILELNFENDTLKLHVNLEAAQASQLKLDARLLAMATRVIREKEHSGT